jgi:hypothetical protein
LPRISFVRVHPQTKQHVCIYAILA